MDAPKKYLMPSPCRAHHHLFWVARTERVLPRLKARERGRAISLYFERMKSSAPLLEPLLFAYDKSGSISPSAGMSPPRLESPNGSDAQGEALRGELPLRSPHQHILAGSFSSREAWLPVSDPCPARSVLKIPHNSRQAL